MLKAMCSREQLYSQLLIFNFQFIQRDAKTTPQPFIFWYPRSFSLFASIKRLTRTNQTFTKNKKYFVAWATPRPRRTERVIFYSVYFLTYDILSQARLKCNRFFKISAVYEYLRFKNSLVTKNNKKSNNRVILYLLSIRKGLLN